MDLPGFVRHSSYGFLGMLAPANKRYAEHGPLVGQILMTLSFCYALQYSSFVCSGVIVAHWRYWRVYGGDRLWQLGHRQFGDRLWQLGHRQILLLVSHITEPPFSGETNINA